MSATYSATAFRLSVSTVGRSPHHDNGLRHHLFVDVRPHEIEACGERGNVDLNFMPSCRKPARMQAGNAPAADVEHVGMYVARRREIYR